MARRRIGLLPVAEDVLFVLGSQVRSARHRLSWTQADLAARAGVTAKVVSAIESGAASVSAGNLFNVASLAGVSLFGAPDRGELALLRSSARDQAALMRDRVRRPREDDDARDF